MSVYRDIERILPLEYRHGHGIGPGISALFCFFDLPVFGDCPVLSIVPAGHVHLDAVQLIACPIKFGGIDHGLVLGVAAIYIEIVRGKFPVGTVDQYVIKGGADAVDGIRTKGGQCQNDKCSPHVFNIHYLNRKGDARLRGHGKLFHVEHFDNKCQGNGFIFIYRTF